MNAILAEVAAERQRQDAKWREQNHPDGTGPSAQWAIPGNRPAWAVAQAARAWCQALAAREDVTWLAILHEEVAEAFAEHNPQRLRAELIQVAAVAVAWAEAIDRRTEVAP